jgi:hypothetical protein
MIETEILQKKTIGYQNCYASQLLSNIRFLINISGMAFVLRG